MTIADLTAYGANIEEGLQRCMDNEDFYLRMVKMIPGDANFGKLFDAIGAGDLQAAFEAAHAIKGSTGNLALSPIFDPVSEITELLRTGEDTDYTELVESIRRGHEELARICAE